MSLIVLRARAGLVRATVFLAVLAAVPSFAHAQRTLTMSQALDIAVARAPEVAARQASAEGAAAAQISAGQLPDPRLVLGLDNVPVTGPDPFSLTSDSMTQGKIGWAQEMLNAAKRKARSEVAQALTARERALLAAERQIVKRATALAWLNRYFAEKRLALFGALERENRVLQDTVNARVAAGRALPADAIATRQEALQLADRRDELELECGAGAGCIERWVGDAADATLAGEPQIPTLDAAHLRENLARHVELAVFEPMAADGGGRSARSRGGKARRLGLGGQLWQAQRLLRGHGLRASGARAAAVQRHPSRSPESSQSEKRFSGSKRNARRCCASTPKRLKQSWPPRRSSSRKLARLRDSALPLADERVRLLMASYEARRVDLGAVLSARGDRIETRLKVIETRGGACRIARPSRVPVYGASAMNAPQPLTAWSP